MDIGSAISFVFEDEEWVQKLLLGAVVMLIPFFGMFALMGYGIAVIRNVRNGAARPLPGWGDIGQYFMDGLMVSLALMIYSLPFIILTCPMVLVSFWPTAFGDNEQIVNIMLGLSGILALVLGCVMLLYSVALMLLSPVVQIKYAETGSIGECLRFGAVFRFMFNNIGNLVISQLALVAGGMVVGVIGGVISAIVGVLSLIPICGWILGFVVGLAVLPLSVWLIVFPAHLYGQISRQTSPPVGMGYMNYPV